MVKVHSEDITAFKDKYGISDKSYLYFEDPSMVLPPASLLFKKDVTLTVEDSFEMLYYDTNHNWLEKIVQCGLFTGKLDDTYTNIKAIVDVTSSDLEVTPAEISENFLIDETDVAELISVVRAAEASNQTVYLFRFDVQDYYSEEICARDYSSISVGDTVTGYYFEQNYYQDFDVMEIAFRDNHNRITILPVTMTPSDVVGDATAPVDPPTVFDDFGDWLDGLGQNNPDNPFWRIFAIILGVFLVVVIVILIVKSVSNSQKSSSSHASRRRKRR